ncbi:MAG: hypothetical protein ACPGO3_13230 [Magnetospiraceae bacterium]
MFEILLYFLAFGAISGFLALVDAVADFLDERSFPRRVLGRSSRGFGGRP